MASIRIENLTVMFGNEVVLYNFNFEYVGNGLVQIIGPNGAGKTTLLKAIVGLIKPVSGRVLINGYESNSRLVNVGYVPQKLGFDSYGYPFTVFDYLVSNLLIKTRRRFRLIPRVEEKRIVSFTLSKVGLSRDKWLKRIDELSGGELQRVLIAKALIHNPSVLLLDEPFSNIDPEGRFSLAKTLVELSKEKIVLVTSHDPYILLPYTDIIVLLNKTKYYVGKPSEVLTRDNIVSIYGDNVVESILGGCFILDHHVEAVK